MGNRVKLKRIQNKAIFITGILAIFLCSSFIGSNKTQRKPGNVEAHPKIVNIINFVRDCEPRSGRDEITNNVLYQTVANQVNMMKKYNLKGTFLLQYDALIDPRYQELFKSLPAGSFEIGCWLEIPQQLVEKAGLKWRGRYSWDWYADVDFSIGYTPEEREKLVDVYMNDFKQIYGYYPKSAGSWFMDAHTLDYMYRKYGIISSCNCRDQIGTDGYNLWGGYWNQAYYASLKNYYMPAQHESAQIPVPIFRMLGSDPIRQYDMGLGTKMQGVVTLEPVYKNGGGDSTWVNWYFKEFLKGECMEYAYVQVGQENSFTWDKMAKGFAIQLPLVARLRDEKKVRVETLAESGKWFREHYKVTPSTSVTVNNDLPGSDRKTVWFNSRFYRVNLLWENGTLRFRDIHVFNENLPSDYLTRKGTSTTCFFYTLPFVDGFSWSTADKIAGLRVKAVINGKETLIEGGNPVVKKIGRDNLHIVWPLKSVKGEFVLDIDAQNMEMQYKGIKPLNWYLDLTTAEHADLPFSKVSKKQIDCRYKCMDYSIKAANGFFSTPGNEVVYRINPDKNILLLNFSQTNSLN